MKKRPFLCLGLAALTAQFAGTAMPSAVCWLLAAFCTFLFIMALVARKSFLSAIITVISIVFLIQGFAKAIYVESIQSISDTPQQTTLITEDVFDGFLPHIKNIYATVLQAEEPKLVGKKVKIMVLAPVEVGEILQGKVAFSPLTENEFAAFAKAETVFLQGESENLEVVGVDRNVKVKLLELQESMSSHIKRYLRKDLGAIVAAVSIGDKSALTAETKTVFRLAGLSHVLVVSGMHLSIWCGLWIALGACLKHPRIKFILAAVMSIAFAVVTGLSPSMIRALVAMLIYCCCGIFMRCADGLNSLGLAILVLVISNPFICYDGSFWLSISATAGIFYADLAMRRIKLYHKKLCGYHISPLQKFCLWAIKLVSVPFFASLATIPVLICLGMEVVTISVLSNLVVGALLFPQLLFGWLCLFASWFFPTSFLHHLFAFCAGLISSLILNIATWFSELPFGSIQIEGVYPVIILVIIALLWIVLWKLKCSRWLFAVVPLYLWIGTMIMKTLLSSTLTLVMVGSQNNPCTIVFDQQNAVVLFQGRISNQTAVEEFLTKHNLEIKVLVDMRMKPKTQCQLPAERVISIQDVAAEGMPFDALDGKISAALYRQKQQGALALVEMYGLTAAIPYGNGCWEEIPKTTFLILGNGVPKDFSANWVLTKQNHPWARKAERVFSGQQPAIRVWPSKGIRLERDLK